MTRMPRWRAASRNDFEVVERAVVGMDRTVVGDVVAVVAQRRREERHQPDGVDAQVLQIIELLRQPAKIADAVAIAVVQRAHVHLINDRVFVPERSRSGSHSVSLGSKEPAAQTVSR